MPTPTIEQLLLEAMEADETFWFVRSLVITERTDRTITIHLQINDDLFIQTFLSLRSNRLSLALVSGAGRLYGCDYERGGWHYHPFGETDVHAPMPMGMSPRPLLQFVAMVEELLLAHDLL
ncbi:MAG: hypothetical protein ACOYNY_10910 [Caldilineaceae bacterium]